MGSFFPIWLSRPHRARVPFGKGEDELGAFVLGDFEVEPRGALVLIFCISVFFTPCTVSLATRAASSVSFATVIAFAKVRSVSLILNIAFSTASLLMEHMKRVRRASSEGSAMEVKSHVTAPCRIRAASSCTVSPGFRFMSDQNLYLSRIT